MNASFPLIIGGLIPAFLWRITAVFQKLSAGEMLGPGRYLTLFGVTVALVGAVYSYISNETLHFSKGAAYAMAAGLAFSLGAGLLSFALYRYNLPISRVTPVLSANVLVPVVADLLFLGEGANINVTQLIMGALYIIGGVFVVVSA